VKNLDLFNNLGKGGRQFRIKNMVFDIYWDKEDEAVLDEVLQTLDESFKREEERIGRLTKNVDWATVLVNAVLDITYRYTLLKNRVEKLEEALKFNVAKIESVLEDK